MPSRLPSSTLRWACALAACVVGGSASATQTAGSVPGVASPGAHAPVRVAIRLPQGGTRVYRIKSTGTFEVDYGLLASSLSAKLGQGPAAHAEGASRRQKGRYALSATLHWRVVAEDGQGVTLTARLQDVDYRVDGEGDARREQLELPFTMRLDRVGALQGFGFRAKYPEALAQAIRGLVEPLQVVLAADGASAWTARETSAAYAYDAHYEQVGVDAAAGVARLKKTRSGLVPQPGTLDGLPGKVQVKVLRSESNLELSLAGAGVERVEAAEELATYAGDAFVSSNSGSYSAVRVDAQLAALPATAAALAADLADTTYARARLYDVAPELAAEVEGRTVAEMMAAYGRAVSGNSAVGHRLLMNYVRRYPARALEVARGLDAVRGEGADRAVGFGFAAFASAGHTEAQQALVRVMGDGAFSALSREKALVAMMELQAPEPSVLAAVWIRRSELERAAATDPGARLLQSMATNVYGALGDVRKGNPAVTAEVVRNLAKLLASAQAPHQQQFALDALSNVGDAALVIPLVAPSFAATAEQVRTAAFSTFRRMQGEAAFETFASRFAAEKSPAVRVEALRTAAAMEESPARNAWAIRQVQAPRSADEASVLVRVIGKGMATHPENAAVLRGLLDSQHDRRVRREIYAFVSPSMQEGK